MIRSLLTFILAFILFGCSSPQKVLAQASDEYVQTIKEHRAKYKQDFLIEERSPLKETDLVALNFFPPNEDWVMNCEFERTPNAKPFELPTYSGITKPYIQYGWLTFKKEGQILKLAIYESMRLRMMPQYRDHLFLPFKDASNGKLTYGGGRYLDLNKQDIKRGKAIVDFNKAYNPWCAYSDGYNCPVPPAGNHLKISITAGEKSFGKK